MKKQILACGMIAFFVFLGFTQGCRAVKEPVPSNTATATPTLTSTLVLTPTVTSTLTVTPTPCVTFGYGALTPGDFGVAANNVFASSYILSTSAEITGFTFYSRNFSGHVLLAIYSDNAGSPRSLIVQTPFTAVAATGNTVINLTTPVDLAAGSYWLACLTDQDIVSVANTLSGKSLFITGPANGYGPLLDPFGANGAAGGNPDYDAVIDALSPCQ